MRNIVILIILLVSIRPSMACTIFVLTDGTKVLFFNNEDYTNPNNRIWFVPQGKDHFGCVYVGYDDGSAQGGMNTHGLAFDWYAGMPTNYQPEPSLEPIEDNSSERMLERCRTVEDAIKFYQTYAEPGFAKATIIIADKTGASVIIGAKNGKLFFEKSSKSNVLGGQGKETFERLYNNNTPINLVAGSSILKQCVATGRGGTLYSNSYDLNTGNIYVYDFSEGEEFVTLNLYEELGKGEHFYDINRIASELQEPIKPLELNMERLILFEYHPLEYQEPQISTLVKNIFIDGAIGNLKAEYFSANLWNELKPIQEDLKSELESLGEFKSHELIKKEIKNEFISYSYIMLFEKARVLQQFDFDKNGKVANLQTLSAFITNPSLTKGESNGNKYISPIRFNEIFLTVLGLVLLGITLHIFRKKRIKAI